MKRMILPAMLVLSFNAFAEKCDSSEKYTLVVHGGVGYTSNQSQKDVLNRILQKGHELLRDGSKSIDVVQYVVEEMEDSGVFNAGKGGTRTNQGTVELDASIMDGSDLSAGSVASVGDVKNPIRLARNIKDKTRHVMIVGPGASRMARKFGMEMVTSDYFTSQPFVKPKHSHYGTVGAVALDRCKNLASATSTGGLYGKAPGRVGDSPIIGAGTYANNSTVAVSATGEGEKFIRASVGVRISNILQYTSRSLTSAVSESLRLVEKLGGTGGIISVNKNGEVVWDTSNKDPMPRGMVKEDGNVIQIDSEL